MSDMDDSGPYVELDRDELGIYKVTLNRPDRINAINLAMRDELWQIFLLLSSVCINTRSAKGNQT